MSQPYYKRRFSNAAVTENPYEAHKDPATVRLTVKCDREQGSVICNHPLSKQGTTFLLTGTTVTLTAMPAEGYVFDHWTSISGDAKTSPVITEKIDTDRTIGAVFAKEEVIYTGGNGVEKNVPIDDLSIITEKAKAFLKEWWWAVIIAVYVAYRLWKGGEQ